MPEYDIAFAKELVRIAKRTVDDNMNTVESARAIIYLGRLSMEISMKAALEVAGKPLREIRDRSHDLRGLLEDLGACEVEVDIANGHRRWMPAQRLRGQTIRFADVEIPVGVVIEAEDHGASRYPVQIRYGHIARDFPAAIVADAAAAIADWIEGHLGAIRVPP